MWVRKRIDFRNRDLVTGLIKCALPTDPRVALQRINKAWGVEDTIPTLSVRSGFDLLLQATNWAPGSQVIMSGLNISDMPRILKEHQFEPIGIDLDPFTLSPSVEEIEQAITPNTRAILIAHLFGGLVDLDPYFEVARKHNLLLIEDCAQSYVGNHDLGDPRADLSMFSFGPIKTNTALAGAVLRVRRDDLLARMNSIHSTWPMLTRFSFLKRIQKYAFIKLLSTRTGMKLLSSWCHLTGQDHDRFISQAARGFPGADFFSKIRHQPSLPMLRMMARKIEEFDPNAMAQRQQKGLKFLKALRSGGEEFISPGEGLRRQTFWVLTLLVDDPQQIAAQLWKEGFDATNRCSLEVVGSRTLPNCQYILDHILFVPFDSRIPDSEMERMARVILKEQMSSLHFPDSLPSTRQASLRK